MWPNSWCYGDEGRAQQTGNTNTTPVPVSTLLSSGVPPSQFRYPPPPPSFSETLGGQYVYCYTHEQFLIHASSKEPAERWQGSGRLSLNFPQPGHFIVYVYNTYNPLCFPRFVCGYPVSGVRLMTSRVLSHALYSGRQRLVSPKIRLRCEEMTVSLGIPAQEERRVLRVSVGDAV